MSVIEASWFEIAVRVNTNPQVNFSPISILISMPNSHPGYHQFELYCKRMMWNQLQWCRDPDGEASWYNTVVHVNLTLLATRGMLLAAVFNVLVSMLDSLANTSSTPLRAKKEEMITYAST